MKTNMREWINALPNQKKAFPILSFPCIALLDCTVQELIASSDKQAEGMIQIARRTNSAAAVSLMDLSVEAECFGASVHFSEDEVPTVTGRLIESYEDAEALQIPAVGTARSGIYVEAIQKALQHITDRPVFAGMIGPYSLAARLFDVSEIMMDCYDDPDMVHLVLDKVTTFLIEYAKAYKAVGAHGIVLAEPVSGLLSPAMEEEFSAPYVKRIVDAVQDESFLLIYHNCGDNTPLMINSFISMGAAAYHFGNSIDMKAMLEKFPDDIPVMGNIDPAEVLCMGTPQMVRAKTLDLMKNCSPYRNFVLSSGCDIPPLSPWTNLDAFFEAAEEYYASC